jgi:aldehyde dehydrogenase (NAD+)
LKPAQVAPLDAVILTEIIDAAGLPEGVFNLVTGTGRGAGEALVDHPEVDMISFTGSTLAGKTIAAKAAGTIKRLTLELGGKSPNVLLDDLDDEAFAGAVRAGVANCYMNSGQTCTALTRMLVPRSRMADAERIAAEEVEQRYQAGDPFTKGVRLGPLASQTQVETVIEYINQGLHANAKLIAGGPERPTNLDGGFYVSATVFSEVDSSMAIAQEEIFGPVLSILAYEDEEQAVAIANDSPYGLAGAVWSSAPERAEAVARRIRTGKVDINGAAHNPEAPFGGYKQSGYGRENGVFGFEEFLELKAVQR